MTEMSTFFAAETFDKMEFSSAIEERAFYRAILLQAILDAKNESWKPEMRRAKKEAIEWLRGGRGFETVCDRAGYDPSYVQRKLKEAQVRGYSWRLPAGQGWRVQERLLKKQTEGETL